MEENGVDIAYLPTKGKLSTFQDKGYIVAESFHDKL